VPPSVIVCSLLWCGVVCLHVWCGGVSLSVGGPPSGASWAACGGSALNAPSWGFPSLSALVGSAVVMLSLRWRASGASWARCARSALNAPVPRLRSLLASADYAIKICNRLGAFVCGQLSCAAVAARCRYRARPDVVFVL